jgi:hypothetical protein
MTKKSEKLKEKQIAYIKKVIKEWGSTTAGELQLESSPCVNSLAGGDVCELIESFNIDDVESVVYDRKGNEIDWNNISYEDLSEDLIDEIYNIIEAYEADMIRTEKRCQS